MRLDDGLVCARRCVVFERAGVLLGPLPRKPMCRTVQPASMKGFPFGHFILGLGSRVTPDERHHGREESVLVNRVRVYERARSRNPNRWSRGTRNWSAAPAVFLNPKRHQETIASSLSRETTP